MSPCGCCCCCCCCCNVKSWRWAHCCRLITAWLHHSICGACQQAGMQEHPPTRSSCVPGMRTLSAVGARMADSHSGTWNWRNHQAEPPTVARPTYRPMTKYRTNSQPSTMPSLALHGHTQPLGSASTSGFSIVGLQGSQAENPTVASLTYRPITSVAYTEPTVHDALAGPACAHAIGCTLHHVWHACGQRYTHGRTAHPCLRKQIHMLATV